MLVALVLALALALVLALILALIMAVLVLVILIHLDGCGGMNVESGGLEMQCPGNEGKVTPEKLRLKALPPRKPYLPSEVEPMLCTSRY